MHTCLNRRRARGGVFVSAALAIIAIGSPAFSQTVMSVSEVAAYALENSREIQAAEKEVTEAGETISKVFNFDRSSLTVSTDYNYAAASEGIPISEEKHAVHIDGSATISIAPELSVSAGLAYPLYNAPRDENDELTGSLRLNYTPFGDPSTEWQEWETFRKAEIRLTNLKNTVPMNAEMAALNLAKRQLDLQAAELAMELAEREYEIDQRRYELDDITYVDLEESRANAGTLRQAYYNSLKSLLSLKKNLIQIIGPDLRDIEVDELSTEDVLLLVRERETALKAAEAGEAASVHLLSLAVETEALKRQLASTPVFRPSLALSGSMNFNDLRAGAGVSLTLSPDQFQTEERAEIEDEIADRTTELVLEQAYVDLEVRMLEQSISIAREALDISISDYETSRILYRETELFYARGERTDLELEQSSLSLFSASIRVFSSAVDLYANLGDLLKLYLLD